MNLSELEKIVGVLLKNDDDEAVKRLLFRVKEEDPVLYDEFIKIHGK